MQEFVIKAKDLKVKKVKVIKGELWYEKLVNEELEVINYLPKVKYWTVCFRGLPHPIPDRCVETIEGEVIKNEKNN